ncbi:PLD nuclease N-terminal domain-containing protein [Cohnella ginsengisoli]|uniref:PLD nuclease N-terminal domain-containing protein n=1 Tax=Cohnella ginsengisoli TaxID=425004 RepID=A0A9X4KKS7_9BACL|nr:PLD nuclease N-terminal domain-containing protein [Cohnella ginsengisoli]MDG0794037.1 PLD nuclease N-terminal domain-containing protein [Cohnella ginsengisoli]
MDKTMQIVLPILLIQLILMIVALVDVAKIERTRGPKWMWVLLILFASMLGSVSYFIFGRRND